MFICHLDDFCNCKFYYTRLGFVKCNVPSFSNSIVPGTRDTHWNGTCRGTMWEAVRASSAAPGYFEEYKKEYNIHQVNQNHCFYLFLFLLLR